MITLKKILTEQNILVGLKTKSYAQALGAMLEASSQSAACDWSKLAQELMAHELGTPSVRGNGVAIPHIRSDLATNIDCWIATLEQPTDLLEVNGSKLAGTVGIIAMFAVPTKMSTGYLQIVGSLARSLQNEKKCQRLVEARTAGDFLEYLFGA